MQRGRRRGFEVDQPMDKEHRASNLIPSPVPKKKKKKLDLTFLAKKVLKQ